MSIRAFAFVYLLGGLTFLPLVLFVLLGAAWASLPRVDPEPDSASQENSTADKALQAAAADEAAESRSRNQSLTGDAAASGSFAVLRRYDFQAATAALNARNSSREHGGSNGGTVDGSVTGDHAFNSPSESVYQSMYRSVFDRNKTASSTSSLLEKDESTQLANGKAGKRKLSPANVLYIVLRHGHLMLYDSPAQVEVKHVISLAHYHISLQAGEGIEELEDDKRMREADLFIKRTAIVLKPINLPYGTQRPGQQGPAKPFYLFSNVNIEREDFYHALLATRSKPPIPQALDTNALIKLQSNLHSVSLTPETRALNALIGRVFLALHHTDNLNDLIRGKIEKKLSRIQKPSFIPTLLVKSIDMGDAGPVFSNPRLRDLNISGDLTISTDMRYNGGLSITLFAVAKLDLGSRFKARSVDLILKTTIQRIQGTMLLRIKPPPSNRMWSCFEIMPEMEIRVEPVVSDRKITYGFVLRTIEDRLRIAIAEGLVKPNWDDTPLPLADTLGSVARGGIWVDEGEEETANSHVPSEPEPPAKKHERTLSMPIMVGEQVEDAQSSAVDQAASADIGPSKLKYTASMPIEDQQQLKRRPVSHVKGHSLGSSPERMQSSPSLPRPLRSPSLGTSVPSVAVDGQNVEPVRSDDASLRQASVSNRRIWRSRASDSGQPAKDAVEELRVVRDRAQQAISRPSEMTLSGSSISRSETDVDDEILTAHGRQASNASLSEASTSRPFTLGRTNSDRSVAESTTSTHSQTSQQRKQTLLAATAAATSAARTWGWNAYQRNKGALPRGFGKREQASVLAPGEPIGRGQPLPPPGVPLPGPQKTAWSNVGNLRRKPVPALPPRRNLETNSDSPEETAADGRKEDVKVDSQNDDTGVEADDEYGPWSENSGLEVDVDPYKHTNAAVTDGQIVEKPSIEGEGDSHDPGVLSSEEDSVSDLPDTVINIGDQSTAKTASVAEPAASIQPKKIPPPLPARRQHFGTSPLGEDPSDGQQADLSLSTKLQGGIARDQSDNESSLRVPDAAIEAVAAENATPALAQGAADDEDAVNGAEGDLVTSEGVHHDTSRRRASDTKVRPASAEEELKRVSTLERFARGEDLEDEDFEPAMKTSEERARDKEAT